MGRGSTQEPPWRFVQFPALLSQSVNLFHLAFILAIVSSRSFLGSFHRPIPVRYNWSVFACKMHSTSEFAKIVLSKCVCVGLVSIPVFPGCVHTLVSNQYPCLLWIHPHVFA